MTGREAFEERFGFRAKGEFRCKAWFEIPLTAVGLAILVLGELAIFCFLMDPNITFGGGRTAVPLFLVVWAIFCWWIVRIAHLGETYRYEADEKEFRIYEPNSRTEIFYYTDVTGIDYQPIHYINKKLRGYKVTISTKYRKKEYNYIFTRNKVFKDPEGSPFYLIEQRAGLVEGFCEEGGASRIGGSSNGTQQN